MAVPTSITDLSTTAASNSPAGSDSVGSPGTIDDYFRGYGAVQRAESLNKSWERWNHTPTYISATQFSVTGDKTAQYTVNRRVKCTVTAGTVYGYISASAFGAVTTVTVVLDSGSLDSGLSEVQLGPETYARGTSAMNAFLSVPTSANLRSALTDETGTGAAVFATGPTFSGGRVNIEANSEIYALGIKYNGTTGTYYVGASNSASPDLIFSTGAGAERLRLTDDGRLYGTALHNNAGAVTGTTNQYIASGTYTPTFTNSNNCTSIALVNSIPFQWIRVGNVVTVSGFVNITPTSTVAGTSTAFYATLPIASSFGANNGLLAGAGAFSSRTTANDPVQIYGEASGSNRATVIFLIGGSGGANQASVTFTYLVA